MISRLKDSLVDDKAVPMAWCAMRDTQLVGAIARQGYSAVLLDAQHGFHDEQSFLECIPHIIMAGKSPIVRIPVDRWDLCQRALDFGALSVVAPMINTIDDALAFAKATKFPATGDRSYGPRYAASLYGISTDEYVTSANAHTFSLAQIETAEAYQNLDDILSVDGIDGVLMGPSDFSISVTGNQTPDVYGNETVDMIRDIAERTRSKGKVAAAFTMNAEHANLVYSMGYRLISITIDSSIVSDGAAKSFEGLDF
ncbi:MAG: aldolase/citrate lyase family protein [Pseudomonadota bacterium]